MLCVAYTISVASRQKNISSGLSALIEPVKFLPVMFFLSQPTIFLKIAVVVITMTACFVGTRIAISLTNWYEERQEGKEDEEI